MNHFRLSALAAVLASIAGIAVANATPVQLGGIYSKATSSIESVRARCYWHDGRRRCGVRYYRDESYDGYGYGTGISIGIGGGRGHHGGGHGEDHGGAANHVSGGGNGGGGGNGSGRGQH